ncbi:hypothetical protein AL036_11505 [Salipiger aestuarii]|uniref:YqaA family protein n=1 Tax=Salipiger aestuarii TaxID=568098 RepID=UPI00123C7574|nr:YqaA family protein [Salipiger aestuarii]KAA8607228.1 hypothetical protein AL036_11505 [Salipiger aestuarii]
MLSEAAALGGLFLAAFGAATILPFQSEVVFVGMQLGQAAPLPLIVLVASVGNVLGAVANYLLGIWLEHYRHRRWFPVTQAQMDKAKRVYARWGVWTLLFSWAPLGDAFTVVAGVMRTHWLVFLILVTLAKTGRYVALAWATALASGGS